MSPSHLLFPAEKVFFKKWECDFQAGHSLSSTKLISYSPFCE